MYTGVWRNDHTPIMLSLLQQHECLWNSKSIDYKNKTLKETAYKAIIDELKMPELAVHDVKAKIKSIRTRYSAELSKVLQSTISGDSNNVYVPKLVWFQQADTFLRAVCIPRNTPVTSTIIFHSEDDSNFEDEIDQHTNFIINTVDEVPKDASPKTISNNFRECMRPKLFSRKRTSAEISPTLKMAQLDAPLEKLKKLASDNDTIENEFDYFCKSLAIQLKNMPLNRALICQENLLKVITEERLNQIKECSQQQQQLSHSSATFIDVEVNSEINH
ncbi:hypothetical protein CHUAL_011540 [Chamberlinius hualienensis]